MNICFAKVQNKQHYAHTYIVRLHCKLWMHVTNDRRWRRNSHVFTQELWRLQKTWRCQGHASLHGCNPFPMQPKGALAEHGGTGKNTLRARESWELIYSLQPPSGIIHYSCVLRSGHWWVNMAAESLNDELEYVKLYRIRPLLLHFYLGPFIPIYLTWLYFWTVVYGATDYFEAGLIALAAVGILQILSCLFCHWSVHVRCLFTCSAVRIP